MYLKKIPRLFHSLFSKALWRVNDTQSIFLTFDDGPDPESTPLLLELLHKAGIGASFFCNGERAKKYPHLIDTTIYLGGRLLHLPTSIMCKMAQQLLIVPPSGHLMAGSLIGNTCYCIKNTISSCGM